MKFTDFKQKDLIGKLVVWTTSNIVPVKAILPIVKAERFGFQIKDNPDKWFSYRGHEKIIGNNAKSNVISYCILITADEAKGLIDQWQITKAKLSYISIIDTNQKNLIRLSVDQLSSIVSIITQGSGNLIVDSTEIKTESPQIIIPSPDSHEAIKLIQDLIAQLQSDHIQLVKKYRDQIILLNAKLNNNGK